MKRLNKTMKKFISSQEGSAMPLLGLGILALVGSTGVAVDMGRAQIAQSRMSAALDAAGLAAGASANTLNISTEANKYFYANYPLGYMGTTISSLSVSASSDLKLITLSSRGTVPTTFMKIFGVNSIPIKADSEITRANAGMELVLVMDTTGSMAQSAGGGQTKIQAAKSAANTLLNILYGSKDTQENLWVGLVPFAQAVNVGPTRTAWTLPDTFNFGPTTWEGCVDARELNNRDVTDDPPVNLGAGNDRRFPRYYWPCDTNNQWYGTNSSKNNCATSPAASVKYQPLSSAKLGPNKACSQAVTALTASKTTVSNAISTLTTNGNTHIALGAVWGWRMLSPSWRGTWGGEMNANNLPLDYRAPLMNKVVVLMTDGDNTIDNTSHGAYWYLSDGKLGTTNQSTAETRLDTRLTQVCTSMKNNGILVYTVGFGTGISNATKTLLQGCASKPDYFFYSPTGADLQNSFKQIGDSLANLRISL